VTSGPRLHRGFLLIYESVKPDPGLSISRRKIEARETRVLSSQFQMKLCTSLTIVNARAQRVMSQKPTQPVDAKGRRSVSCRTSKRYCRLLILSSPSGRKFSRQAVLNGTNWSRERSLRVQAACRVQMVPQSNGAQSVVGSVVLHLSGGPGRMNADECILLDETPRGPSRRVPRTGASRATGPGRSLTTGGGQRRSALLIVC